MKIKNTLKIAVLAASALAFAGCASQNVNVVPNEPTNKIESVVNDGKVGPYLGDVTPQVHISKLIDYKEYKTASDFLQVYEKKFGECESIYYEGLIGYGLATVAGADTTRTQEELTNMYINAYETLLNARECKLDNWYPTLTQGKKDDLDTKIEELRVKLASKALYR